MIPAPRLEPLDASLGCLRKLLAWLEGEALAAEAPLLVGIGGPGGSGKSTLAAWLHGHLPGSLLLSLDDFRLPRSRRPAHAPFGSHPEASDLPRLRQTLADFRLGKPFLHPRYDPATGEAGEAIEMPAARVLLAEGELAAHAALRPLFDRFILVEAHWRTQLEARLSRDLREGHCNLEKLFEVFLQSNLRDYPRFAEGAREAAHALVYRNARHAFALRAVAERAQPPPLP